jgi:FtsP/CotA-like multicopper oxidase with cupredoxin domain
MQQDASRARVLRDGAIRAVVAALPFALAMTGFLLPASSEGAERHFELALENGKLAESAPTLKVAQGDEVVLDLRSDRDVELHLHGYSLKFELAAGKPAAWRFAVPTSGRFPLAVHGHGGHGHATLLYLEVHPD